MVEEAMDEVLEANREAGLPPIDVSASQGKFLYLLAKIKGAKRILEIGTLGGYSTIWMARALPQDGKLITLEYEQKHADVALRNLQRTNVASLVEIKVGPALKLLPLLAAKEEQSFDLIFIDADKGNNPHYLQWALTLSQPGSIIVIDNVVREGHVIDEESKDQSVIGSRALLQQLQSEGRLEATALQTVGIKGYDGFILGVVRDKG
nr:O-methyltransferase [Fictibacillus macauensis]